MWDFQGSWFLALEILRANTILWNIQERSFVSSGISRGKEKKKKLKGGGGFKKVCLFFFWNSPMFIQEDEIIVRN